MTKTSAFFVVDAKYFPLALIQAKRLLDLQPRPFRAHIFVDGQGADTIVIPGHLDVSVRDRLIVHRNALAPFFFDGLTKTRTRSQSAYGRLFAPTLLDEDRLLYLDVDIVITGPITDLLGVDLKGHSIAAVHDSGILAGRRAHQPRHSELRQRDRYFNAGVVLIDGASWRKRDFKTESIAFFAKFGRDARLMDQDFLNFAFRDDWVPVSPRWNFQGLANEVGLFNAVAPRIIHFTGKIKPWHRISAQMYPPLAGYFTEHMAAAGVSSADLWPLFDQLSQNRMQNWLLVMRQTFASIGIKTPTMYKAYRRWQRDCGALTEAFNNMTEALTFADPFERSAPVKLVRPAYLNGIWTAAGWGKAFGRTP